MLVLKIGGRAFIGRASWGIEVKVEVQGKVKLHMLLDIDVVADKISKGQGVKAKGEWPKLKSPANTNGAAQHPFVTYYHIKMRSCANISTSAFVRPYVGLPQYLLDAFPKLSLISSQASGHAITHASIPRSFEDMHPYMQKVG